MKTFLILISLIIITFQIGILHPSIKTLYSSSALQEILKKSKDDEISSDDLAQILWSDIEQEVRQSVVYNKEEGIEVVIENYIPNQDIRMIDIIWEDEYDINAINADNITKTWDHGTNDPDSVTAGIKGLHVYVLETAEIMGVVSNP